MTDTAGNRTDLLTPDPSRPPGDPTAGTYGQGVARQGASAGLPAAKRPDVLGPTTRPGEPVTAGLPIGPGPTAIPLPSRNDKVLAELQALVMASGDPQLAILVGRLQAAAAGGA